MFCRHVVYTCVHTLYTHCVHLCTLHTLHNVYTECNVSGHCVMFVDTLCNVCRHIIMVHTLCTCLQPQDAILHDGPTDL